MATEHPIQGLMKTAMENIKEMVDVNTIVGDPVETPDGSVIMPISKVGFGFAAGGSEFVSADDTTVVTTGNATSRITDAHNANVALPFGGGSGGGVSITPIAFLVVSKAGVKIVPLDNQTHLLERLIDSAPQVVDKIQTMMKGGASATTGMGTTGSASGTTGSSSTNVTNIENQNFIV
ncbi:GerW family sporulation protein [Paenibacillus sp. GD4]|jgi:sporulation protein YtfJ|uniref:GerW family sporulation protein n=1 Tax=Paenibacillus sp. GD4 TaxID=3068890 RepID=UPI002796C17C|nr:GerW family sporulation protein [Paenibacillus sp. GD4]MDQ1909468.1 GerW family sporulation protein [Paenibacillus sp. GD4]